MASAPSVDPHPSTPWQVMVAECHKGVSQLQEAMAQFDVAGAQLTHALVTGMQNSNYSCVGDVLKGRLQEVFASAMSRGSMTLFKEMEESLQQLQTSEHSEKGFEQGLCHVSLLLSKLLKLYFASCSAKMADLVHSLLCINGQGDSDTHATVSREVTKLVLGMGLADGLESPGSAMKTSRSSNSSLPSTPFGSPKFRKNQEGAKGSQSRRGSGGTVGFRIMSLFERKTPPREERKSLFYVDVEDTTSSSEAELSVAISAHEGGTVPVSEGSQSAETSGSGSTDTKSMFVKDQPPIPRITSSGASQLVSEEELESVINLLSGVGSLGSSMAGPHMQVIPEVVVPQGSLQLSVPQMFRMPSPASDSQMEDLRAQKAQQTHRRSEGCLDLSAMGRVASWPHQHHHRASLPSVQIFSASGSQYQLPMHQQRSPGFDTPSPVPSFPRDTPSPSYCVSNPPSPSFFNREPPPPPLSPLFRGHGHYLGVTGSHQRSSWLAPPASPHMGGSLASLNLSQSSSIGGQGWSPYATPGGMGASLSPGVCSAGDTSSWTGVHDSDLSDDSSTEDQFFAVGKDLSHMIGSKDGTSDEEIEHERNPSRAKSSSTWPPPHPHHRPPPIRLPSLDLLEPPDMFRQQHQPQYQQHQQQQQQQHSFHYQQQLAQHHPIHLQWSDPLSSTSSPAPSSPLWPHMPQPPHAPPSSPLPPPSSPLPPPSSPLPPPSSPLQPSSPQMP